MARTKDRLELLDGDPFDGLLTPDEEERVAAGADALVAADTALKRIRLAEGVPQQDLAHRMGVSKSAVAQLEVRDVDAVQLGTLKRYFAALGYRIRFDLEPIDD